jgi:hypothetical protein
VPAIPFDLLWKGLGQNCFGPVNIGILQQDTKLPNLQLGAQQIFRILDWARTYVRIDPTIGSLERAFNDSRHAIHSALANGLNELKSRGRDSAVSAGSDANILASLTGKAQENAAVTGTDIKICCREASRIGVTRGWVDSFISHHSAEVIEKKGSPQEELRLQVARVFPDQIVRSMHEAVQGRPADLVFNSIWMKSGYPTGKTDNRRRWCPRNRRRPFHSSSIISEGETCLGRGLHIREWGMSHSVRRDISGLRGCSPASGGGRDPNWTAFEFDLETPRQTVC